MTKCFLPVWIQWVLMLENSFRNVSFLVADPKTQRIWIKRLWKEGLGGTNEPEDVSVLNIEIEFMCETVSEKYVSKRKKAYEKEVKISFRCLGMDLRRHSYHFNTLNESCLWWVQVWH